MRVWILAPLSLIAACSSGVVKLGPPPWSEDRSGSFIVLRSQGEEPTLIAAGAMPSAGSVHSLELGSIDDADFWMVEQACPLETLGLQEGSQRLSTSVLEGPRLPPSLANYKAELRDGRASDWAAAELPAGLATALERLPGEAEDRYCAVSMPALKSENFSAVLVESLGLVSVEAMALAGDGSLLVGAEFYRDVVYEDYLGFGVYRVELDGTNRRLPELEIGTPRAMSARGDEMIIADHRGIQIGSGDGPYTTVTYYPDECRTAGIATSPLASARQIWVAGQTFGPGILTRIDDDGAVDVLTLNLVEPLPRAAGVAFIAPDQVAAFGLAGPNVVLRVDHGRVQMDTLPITAAIAALRHVPAVGLIALSDAGDLLVDGGQGWKLSGKLTTSQGRELLPYGDGVAALVCTANCAPVLWPWQPTLGFCPVLNSDQRGLSQVFPTESGEWYGVGGVLQPDRILIERFTITRPAAPCALAARQ